jgi:phage shock protein C
MMTPTAASPGLHRSATDKVAAGVCGGLAESLEVDPSLVRIGFVLATIWGGLGLLAYVVLALVLPVGTDPQPQLDEHRAQRTRSAAGALLVAFGAMLLVANVGWLPPWFSWDMFWPGVLILFGVVLLWRAGLPRQEPQL